MGKPKCISSERQKVLMSGMSVPIRSSAVIRCKLEKQLFLCTIALATYVMVATLVRNMPKCAT